MKNHGTEWPSLLRQLNACAGFAASNAANTHKATTRAAPRLRLTILAGGNNVVVVCQMLHVRYPTKPETRKGSE